MSRNAMSSVPAAPRPRLGWWVATMATMGALHDGHVSRIRHAGGIAIVRRRVVVALPCSRRAARCQNESAGRAVRPQLRADAGRRHSPQPAERHEVLLTGMFIRHRMAPNVSQEARDTLPSKLASNSANICATWAGGSQTRRRDAPVRMGAAAHRHPGALIWPFRLLQQSEIPQFAAQRLGHGGNALGRRSAEIRRCGVRLEVAPTLERPHRPR